MKAGIIISVVILIVLGAIIFFATLTPDPDRPTKLTSAKNLEKVEIPQGLPAIFVPQDANASAAESYKAAFALFLANRSELVDSHGSIRTDPPAQLADQLLKLLMDGANAGKVPQGFLDDQIPVEPGAEPAFKDALETLPDVVLNRAKQVYDGGDHARAFRAARAVWALGQRAFEKNVRLYPRRVGISIMTGQAGPQLFDWADQSPGIEAQLTAWAAAMQKLTEAWGPKIELVSAVRPHQGDLINMARNEKDPTLRIDAILAVGVVKFNPNHGGNTAAFNQIMQSSKSDPDPLIAQAGKAAEAFTREQMRRMH